jgi:hypothetical protein
MTRHITAAALKQRDQRNRRIVTLAANVAASAGFLLVAIMIAGWMLTW